MRQVSESASPDTEESRSFLTSFPSLLAARQAPFNQTTQGIRTTPKTLQVCVDAPSACSVSATITIVPFSITLVVTPAIRAESLLGGPDYGKGTITLNKPVAYTLLAGLSNPGQWLAVPSSVYFLTGNIQSDLSVRGITG